MGVNCAGAPSPAPLACDSAIGLHTAANIPMMDANQGPTSGIVPLKEATNMNCKSVNRSAVALVLFAGSDDFERDSSSLHSPDYAFRVGGSGING